MVANLVPPLFSWCGVVCFSNLAKLGTSDRGLWCTLSKACWRYGSNVSSRSRIYYCRQSSEKTAIQEHGIDSKDLDILLDCERFSACYAWSFALKTWRGQTPSGMRNCEVYCSKLNINKSLLPSDAIATSSSHSRGSGSCFEIVDWHWLDARFVECH